MKLRNAVPAFLVALFCSGAAVPRPVGSLGAQALNWNTKQIGNVVAGGSFLHYPSRTAVIEGRACMVGNLFNFDVRDDFAFDIDETVELEVEFYLQASSMEISVSYDKNGAAYGHGPFADRSLAKKALVPGYTSNHWHKAHFTLDRAQFANRGFSKTDLSISGEPPDFWNAQRILKAFDAPEITVCGISLNRSHATRIPSTYGHLALEAVDENGRATGVRLGVYDTTGRSPLPSDDALQLRYFDEVTRVIPLIPSSIPWPSENRSVFYIAGRYHARLPAGDYELIAAKGPEYRIERQRFTVKDGGVSSVKLSMRRWDNMAAKGWYSGDNHVHYARHNADDDGNLLRFIAAEDIHVANVLQYGNSGNTYLQQYNWDVAPNAPNQSYVLIPGQEDPRTGRRGHAIQLHLDKPIRDPSRYLLYHEVFQEARAQGAVVGYAHLSDTGFDHHVRRGLALDVPFGLIDFVEVLQFAKANTRTWFDFLNLGYKLTPSAGSDYPVCGLGAERSYVHVEKTFTPQAWLEGLKRGHTFVTNGPMLEFHVNSKEMGSELHAKQGEPLVIDAQAAINPSIGQLDRLELIEQGEVIKTISSKEGASQLRLRHAMSAKHGTWLVLQAQGKPGKGSADPVAISAPIYVYVDGRTFWKPSAVPKIVSQLKQNLRDVLLPPSEQLQVETWDAHDQDMKFWKSQEPLLRRRVEEVTLLYDELVKRAERAMQH